MQRWDDLVAGLRHREKIIVAFSGGVDSAVLAEAAHEALGSGALMVTASSPSFPRAERDDAVRLASERGWRHRVIETGEMERAGYRENSPDRCYHCRIAFLDALGPLRRAADGAEIAMGIVTDDFDDHRPGIRAARERGVVMPLVDAGFTKQAVRETARRRGLRVWDKPAAACLASRIPYGTPISIPVLNRIEQAERFLHDAGFGVCRVRDHGHCARIEVPAERFAEIVGRRDSIVSALRGFGYTWVALDLGGFRSGSMNEGLDDE